MVHYDPKIINPQGICDYIDDMGFEASLPLLTKTERSSCYIDIKGMTCNSCVQSIEGMLSTKEGISKIKVHLKNQEGYVEFIPIKITPEQIAEQIEDMGFEAYVKIINGKNVLQKQVRHSPTDASSINSDAEEDTSINVQKCYLQVKGMTCGSCVAAIEKHVQKLPGKHHQDSKDIIKYIINSVSFYISYCLALFLDSII